MQDPNLYLELDLELDLERGVDLNVVIPAPTEQDKARLEALFALLAQLNLNPVPLVPVNLPWTERYKRRIRIFWFITAILIACTTLVLVIFGAYYLIDYRSLYTDEYKSEVNDCEKPWEDLVYYTAVTFLWFVDIIFATVVMYKYMDNFNRFLGLPRGILALLVVSTLFLTGVGIIMTLAQRGIDYPFYDDICTRLFIKNEDGIIRNHLEGINGFGKLVVAYYRIYFVIGSFVISLAAGGMLGACCASSKQREDSHNVPQEAFGFGFFIGFVISVVCFILV